MNKKVAVATCGVLLVFIFGLTILNFVLPAKSFSEMENRVLAGMPSFSADKLFSGKYTKEFETYLTDQFPWRDGWVGVKYMAQRGLLKTENNGVYFASNGMLLESFAKPDKNRLETNFEAVTNLSEKTHIPVLFSLVPTSAYIYSDYLPENAPTYDQQIILDQAENVPGYFDLSKVMSQQRDEYIYYSTDHHWTTLGAYYAYCEIARQLGFNPVELPKAAGVLEDFYGTTFSKAGARFIKPDYITYYAFPGVTAEDEAGAEIKINNEEFAGKKDKYSFLFSGNHPLMIIKNSKLLEHRRLVVVRDSYTDSILPFLSQHYSEIHVIDPRYNKAPVAEYAESIQARDILVLFQTGNFSTESSILFIGK